MRPPEYLIVRPADIGRVGVLGAAILALVRFVTDLPGEANGRRLVDGAMWWRATHADIGQALGGVHRDSVRRTLIRLCEAGELLATAAESFYGDRAQAYRVPDRPLRGIQQGSDLPLRENAESITRNAASSCGEMQQAADAKCSNLPIQLKNLEEHSVRKKAQRAPERGTRLPEGWMPDRDVIDTMRAECPQIDLRAEHAKFVDYWAAQPGAKGRKVDWNATWRNWIRRAAEHVPATRGRSAVEANVNDWLEIAQHNDTDRVGGMW